MSRNITTKQFLTLNFYKILHHTLLIEHCRQTTSSCAVKHFSCKGQCSPWAVVFYSAVLLRKIHSKAYDSVLICLFLRFIQTLFPTGWPWWHGNDLGLGISLHQIIGINFGLGQLRNTSWETQWKLCNAGSATVEQCNIVVDVCGIAQVLSWSFLKRIIRLNLSMLWYVVLEAVDSDVLFGW